MKKENFQFKSPFPGLEQEVNDFWDKAQIFEKSVSRESEEGDYVFYDGPPFATGTPHYGHIVGNIMKDVVPRYWTMKGFRVERKWGWDCHGLPIENIVEKELGSKSKKDIEAVGVKKFNELCRSRVLGYVEEWEKVIKKLGRWADMKNSYKTMDLSFMESVWWVFKELYDKDLIYQGYRSMHICPRCETTLSQSEVAEGYKDIKDLSAIAKFELVDEPGTFVLAWTTTPWTLIGNVALAVGGEIDYVKVRFFKEVAEEQEGHSYYENYILAKNRIEEVLKDKNCEIIEELKGKELLGKKYTPLFDYYAQDESLKNRENGWKIYAGDFVTTEEGTGVVHIAPAFGEDDMNLGKQNNLPFIQHVSMDGNFKPEVKDFIGMNVKPKDDHTKTDIEIIKYLAKNNLLFSKEKYEHSYPHCWRCDTPLLNYATSSWFVNITKIKQEMLDLARDIKWSPEHIKAGRFGNWLENARDWSISRQRFWASVMPIWECKCGERKVVGSVAELEALSGQKVTDLHKDVVDDIKFACEKCGGEMTRVPDVLDTWFDSGSMPYAQMHYPFENKEKFENNFPAEFIAEGADQTRCWFYYLHAIAAGVKNKRAYNNVIVNGIVLAEDGKKMSKKLKNYPDPNDIFDNYGSDALRYYLLTSPVMLADNLNFSEQGVIESMRKLNTILWNVYNFYKMFALDFVPSNDVPKSGNILDQWILARLNKLVDEVTEGMENYNLPQASRPILGFIDDLSTWYLRRSRDRFKGDDLKDAENALQTTGFVLLQLSKVMAPFTPFIAEQIWQKVTGNNFENMDKSVHLEKWPFSIEIPEVEASKVLEDMEKVRKIVELGLAKRDEAGIKVRQPLNELRIKNYELQAQYGELLKDEINVKNIKSEIGQGNLEVELDTEITEELKQEGIKRELVRSINSLRKDAGLTIEDKVHLYWSTEGQAAKEAILKYAAEIMKDVLASEMDEEKNSNIDIEKEVNINGEAVWLGLEPVQ